MTRVLGLLILLAMGACADTRTLEELEQEPMQTGDWSAVERREKRMAEQAARKAAGCRVTETLFCEKLADVQRCYCVGNQDRF